MTTAAETSTRRRPAGRRDTILAVALELFARQGYQATGIDEIGAAAGVSGPAIYRHFPSKLDLLAATFIHSWDQRRLQLRARVAQADTPTEQLELLVRDTVENALDERHVLMLYTRELSHLPRDMRNTVLRKQQELTNYWIRVVRRVYPRISLTEARMAVICVHHLIAAIAYTDGGMPPAELEPLLVRMSLAALESAAVA